MRTVFFLLVLTASPLMGADAGQLIRAESVLIRLIDDVDVPAQVAGVLSSVRVVEGQVVEKGVQLAQIDDTEARLTYERARIELEISMQKAGDDIPLRSAEKKRLFSQSQLRRVRLAAQELAGSISQSQLEESELQLAQAELDFERARHDQELAKLTEHLKKKEMQLSQRSIEVRKIVSPIDGVVVEVARKPGEWVELGDQVFRIVRVDQLRAEGFAPAHEVVSIVKGTPVSISVDLPGKPSSMFSGKIVFVSPEISPVNGQVQIWADVANQSGLLRPGLRAALTIRRRDAED